jgi:hypothetical protein
MITPAAYPIPAESSVQIFQEPGQPEEEILLLQDVAQILNNLLSEKPDIKGLETQIFGPSCFANASLSLSNSPQYSLKEEYTRRFGFRSRGYAGLADSPFAIDMCPMSKAHTFGSDGLLLCILRVGKQPVGVILNRHLSEVIQQEYVQQTRTHDHSQLIRRKFEELDSDNTEESNQEANRIRNQLEAILYFVENGDNK